MVRLIAICTFLLPISILGSPLSLAQTFHRYKDRIVGGVGTTVERFPFQASLQFFGYHFCGAVIIKANVLISAGHCVADQDVWYMTVRAGAAESNAVGIVRKVENYTTHENYDPWTLESDIALLFLEVGFDFTTTIQPVKLAMAGEELKFGTKAFVSGWGILEEGGRDLPEKLQYTVVTIWDHDTCREAYDGINEVTATMICAGEMRGGNDACDGDSGGPLTVGDKLFGSVSWGLGCARPGKPSVYAKISALRHWIENKIVEYYQPKDITLKK